MREVVLEGAGGEPLLRFAYAHGFRNLQGVVRRARGGQSPYDYVEMMACPSGCLNGGGQLGAGPDARAGETAAERLDRLDGVVRAMGGEGTAPRDPRESEACAAVYRDWVGGAPGGPEARAKLHWGFRARAADAGVNVSDW